MDLLFDINVAVDICTKRQPFYDDSNLAVAKCVYEGGRIWLYVGSVQTLEYVTRAELKLIYKKAGEQVSARQLEKNARDVLKKLASDKHWLASLAGEGSVFDSVDPEDEQLIRALSRFTPGSIKLLTRDEHLCELYPDLTITPQKYLEMPSQLKAIDFIDLKTQQDLIRPALEENIHRVLARGQYIMGPEIKQLEERLAEYVGVKHCITVSDGTKALLIAMMALGIKAGDEVITTPFTFIATGEMIALIGAIPVFVDIDPRTYNIDPRKIEAAITPKTKAIMPVSLYGQCADFDAINAIAEKHGLPVIEDAAQSFGATYKGKKSCALSTIGSTSFFPSKPLGCYGDGGALFTDDDNLAKLMREIRLHGQDRRYHHPRIGLNGRMDTLQAAIVLAKMDIFEEEVNSRVVIGARYTDLLKSVFGVASPYIEPQNTSVYAQYTVIIENRETVQKQLNESGIPTAVHYPIPLHLQPAFAFLNKAVGSFPIAEEKSRQVMSLPMSPTLTMCDQQRIVSALTEIVTYREA
ncbi:MAG: DegT/DnrJ/EryC1/StrS family aminotransferase [Gallionellaceae bacterium]|jgi:UDP-2-acetamido-2-deoxy-ribo-hexuluronate aminotransferase